MYKGQRAPACTLEPQAGTPVLPDRHPFFRAIGFAWAFGLILLLSWPNIGFSERTAQEITKGRNTMKATKTNDGPGTIAPPIDASAPVRTETATFALG